MANDETFLERLPVLAALAALWVVVGPPVLVWLWQAKTYFTKAVWAPVSILDAMDWLGVPSPEALPGLLKILDFLPFAIIWLIVTAILWGWVFDRH